MTVSVALVFGFAEFVISTLVLVPMSAGRRRGPVEALVGVETSAAASEATEAAYGPRMNTPGTVAPDAPVRLDATPVPIPAPQAPRGFRVGNGPPNRRKAVTAALRPSPGPCPADTGGAP